MAGKTRNIFIAMLSGVVFLLVVALVAAFAYQAGRDSVSLASPVALSVQEVEAKSPRLAPTVSEFPTGATSAEAAESATAVPGPSATPIPTTEVVIEPATTIEPATRLPVQLKIEDLELIEEVWGIIDNEFDGSLPSEDDVIYNAIRGSLEVLDDDFTRFVPPDVAKRSREQLEGGFEGIGAFVDLSEDGYLIITLPIAGQPADIAGLRTGDTVTHVDGRSVRGKLMEEIITEVRGPKGSSVTLTVRRESEPEPLDITIVRDLIEYPVVEAEMLEQNIAYVRLTSFNSNATERLEETLAPLLEQAPRGLIIDLRGNPGGFLSQSVSVADLFLDEGIVVYQRDSSGQEEVFSSDDGDLAEQIPLTVLVGPGSASASEIVAGAVQDRGRGVIIGETTFGKGSVQVPRTLSDGSELRVTIARWYTPNNATIDGLGIVPDIVVETRADSDGDEDAQLQMAVAYILSGE